MKTQMRFQKILMLVSLIIAALCVVYAISFFSGTLYKVKPYLNNSWKKGDINVDAFFNKGQSYVTTSVIMGIVLILLVVSNYITASNSRRNYYVTNYVTIIATVAFALVFAVYGIIVLSQIIDLYTNGINWALYDEQWQSKTVQILYKNYQLSQSSPMFVIGYIVYAVVILNAAAHVLNLLWKVKLMQGEKELLKQGLAKEAA